MKTAKHKEGPVSNSIGVQISKNPSDPGSKIKLPGLQYLNDLYKKFVFILDNKSSGLGFRNKTNDFFNESRGKLLNYRYRKQHKQDIIY